MKKPYIQLMRGYKVEDLIECHPNAFLLLSIIAIRARRTPNLIKNLDVCECHVGDFKKYGLTQQKYRTAKATLERLKLVTFCATNKGTVAKIINTDIYNINAEADNEQGNNTGNEQGNKRVTTNKNDKKEKNEKKENIPPSLEEVTSYCIERKNNINPQKFIDHYESSGWVRGKNKIKSWKACIRTWEGNQKQQTQKQQVPPSETIRYDNNGNRI